ncbi:MAG: 50S ribosomal protein L23 [Candidatus Gottesmanbacteria bacterium]|nr:50S ribosomal protein L23 [Candidatus Gottesmanbacteria bacterium]
MKSQIFRPLISEKSLGLASRGWYTFAVDKHARKEDIAKLIERMYSVNVLSVRTIAMHGKVRRTGKKMISKHKEDWKKAMLQLKAGQHIDAFEVTQQEAPAEEKKSRLKAEDPRRAASGK